MPKKVSLGFTVERDFPPPLFFSDLGPVIPSPLVGRPRPVSSPFSLLGAAWREDLFLLPPISPVRLLTFDD